MRQLVQLEGTSWCGAITAAMVLDHFRIPYELARVKARIAEFEGQKVENFDGTRSDRTVASYLAEQGLLVLFVRMGYPWFKAPGEDHYYESHTPRENRIATWYRVYDLMKSGYVAVVNSHRDAGRHHYVCIDDAFIRAGEHWFSIVCPIRGAYEEQAERFMLTVDGKGDAMEWTFAKRMPARFASAAEFAGKGEADGVDMQVSQQET